MMGEVEARGYPIHGTDKVIIGNSPPMQHVYGLLDRVGPTDMNVLIRGETGTGKELVALALHHSRYPNNGAPFVPVNCAAVPADLLESPYYERLFGSFDRELSSKQFVKLPLVLWSGLFAANLKKHVSAKLKSPAEISKLFLGKIVYEAISTANLSEEVKLKVKEKEVGKKHVPGKVVKSLSSLLRKVISEQKRYLRNHPNIDFANYFKRDDLIQSTYDRLISPRIIKRLRALLVDVFAQIY